MLNHMKSLILNEVYSSPNIDDIIHNLYEESCNYVLKHIHSNAGQERFIETKRIVLDILKTKFSYSDDKSFLTTNRALSRAKNDIARMYDFRSLFETILFNPEKYDNLAFDIAFDILHKIKIRFYDGYVG